jgi:hypothetical protein
MVSYKSVGMYLLSVYTLTINETLGLLALISTITYNTIKIIEHFKNKKNGNKTK